MPTYSVDVKAFINITVEADSENEALEIADSYVEDSLSPGDIEIAGWNQSLEWNDETARIIETSGFSVDGHSEVELADD